METTASPLLGTAYLRAQSTSTSVTPLPPTTSLCLNLSVFKAHLRALRTVDDSIILRLNRSDALSRSLSTSRPNRENSTIGHNECQAFWEELVEGWKGRGEVLEGCLRIVDGSVKAESYGVEKGLDRDRTQLGRGESELEVKVRPTISRVHLLTSPSGDRCTRSWTSSASSVNDPSPFFSPAVRVIRSRLLRPRSSTHPPT